MTPSVLKAQLAVFIRKGKAEALRDYLLSLRNADFRLAGAVLAEKALWGESLQGADIAADFWKMAAVLVAANSRAFLGTMLKAAAALGLTTPTETFAEVCTTAVDCRKALEALLPYALDPAAVNALLLQFRAEETPEEKAGAAIWVETLLFKVGTAPAYFVLFNLLKQHEDDAAYLRRFGVELIRKGDKRSFNLASIVKEYFGLPALPGTFSLSLKPYELSRLDTNYSTFLTILNR